ncbi:MAG: peptidoglycan-binding protein [Acidimicrobiia bacterium]|nr:peptidoglycan-binding protein [Acidimicrobiia bacterium]
MMPRSIEAAHPDAKEHIRLLQSVCRREGLSGPQSAYVLATALHESRLGLWMDDPTAGWSYEDRRRLGNTAEGDGRRYRGRGYARLVGRLQYRQWGLHLDLPLEAEPDLAAVPEIAAEILVTGMKLGRFTGRALAEFVNETKVDYVRARRVMPAADRPIRIAGYARHFEAELEGVTCEGPTKSDIQRAQSRLQAIGWPLAIDGFLGPYTRRAIRDFQSGYTYAELATDGCPDPLTRAALETCAANDGHASEHFRFDQFRTGGSQRLSATNRVIRVERPLLHALERYWEQVGAPVRLDCGYRSVGYNNQIGARPDSEHLRGRAVHVREPQLPAPAVMAMGVFSSIGCRQDLVVHLGVNDQVSPSEPRVYALD